MNSLSLFTQHFMVSAELVAVRFASVEAWRAKWAAAVFAVCEEESVLV